MTDMVQAQSLRGYREPVTDWVARWRPGRRLQDRHRPGAYARLLLRYRDRRPSSRYPRCLRLQDRFARPQSDPGKPTSSVPTFGPVESQSGSGGNAARRRPIGLTALQLKLRSP
jgi:hypothetical protein